MCRRHSVNYLYSLYDALVSINVPSDKARAVVDAMERDMGTTLATKADLAQQRLATKADLAELKSEVKADIAELRSEVKADIAELRAELRAELKADLGEHRSQVNGSLAGLKLELTELRNETKHEFTLVRQDIALVRKDMELLSTSITVRLGSIVVVGLGVMFAALKLTGS
jgi:hypothetical protein